MLPAFFGQFSHILREFFVPFLLLAGRKSALALASCIDPPTGRRVRLTPSSLFSHFFGALLAVSFFLDLIRSRLWFKPAATFAKPNDGGSIPRSGAVDGLYAVRTAVRASIWYTGFVPLNRLPGNANHGLNKIESNLAVGATAFFACVSQFTNCHAHFAVAFIAVLIRRHLSSAYSVGGMFRPVNEIALFRRLFAGGTIDGLDTNWMNSSIASRRRTYQPIENPRPRRLARATAKLPRCVELDQAVVVVAMAQYPFRYLTSFALSHRHETRSCSPYSGTAAAHRDLSDS